MLNGILRHSVHSLKKAARLPCKDRSSVLKILKKNVRKRQGSDRLKKAVDVVSHSVYDGNSSSDSVNNDWSHWVVLKGNEKVAVEDVWGIGKAIGVQFDGESHNMFGVLARSGRGRGHSSSVVSVGGGGAVERGCLEKRKEVRSLVSDKTPWILCLQETKMQVCDDGFCASLWGSSAVSFSYRPSQGASGGGKKVCVCGDFNAVRSREEKRSASVGSINSDFTHFNAFIDSNFLCDLPLGGRLFTWFKGDGKSMSRIDRFLLSEEWCLLWPNCVQIAQLRG
ncbi:hypothetical protein MTR_4g054200 [Medicago truncatula]|uniref:Endonuclease/exonuclease/phosphatase domain-containing protein n=1 Tax=Medicago truncatula TaxID=3880 RepID=G7JJP2_MEDTR|nr:hypothetical protein MTR_4g054200 [Medicago truncatula]